jgi:regulatory protein RepA
MFRVFPAHLNKDGQKVPLIKDWNELASNDPTQIKLWQELFRDRLHFWGVPCGQANGIFVLDIDVKKVNGWESLKSLGLTVPETLSQATPSGGSHLIFKAKPGVHYPNSVNSKTGLDTRGDRGWIAWYGNTNNKPIVDHPDWLLTLNVRKPEPVEVQGIPISVAPEIAQGIFMVALDNVRNAAPGESNVTLNVESFKVGQLVASGSISRHFAEEELFKAAKDRGKPDHESRATIKSGLDGGAKHPLTSPFPNQAPQPLIHIPTAPGPAERWTPQYLTRSDLLNTAKLKKPQLFRDWSTEDIHITTADGGTGKTTLKLYEAICLALGERFLGFENKQRGKTLFITGEDTREKLAAMTGAIMNQMGILNNTPENEAKVETVLNSIVIKKDADLCLIAKDKQNFLYPNPEALRKLLEAVDDIRPKMIVFDPIASFWGSESALNDMNKAVTKFMSELVEKSHACVEMINHMGKSSSAAKDMSQFAGRGGSGLPSNSRVSRVLRSLSAEEFTEMTGGELVADQTAMLCNVNKFSDGSVLFNKPFIIIRNGYLFSRLSLTQAKAREIEKEQSDTEKIFSYIKQQRTANKYPTRNVVTAHFMNNGDPMSQARIKRALDVLEYSGHMGERIQPIENPNPVIKDKALIITDLEGTEI